jgi:hypothetical protein
MLLIIGGGVEFPFSMRRETKVYGVSDVYQLLK